MTTVQKVIKKYFDRKKETTPSFSLRLVARRLEVSPSFVSRMLSGDKQIPYALLSKFRDLLDIEPEVFASLKETYQGDEGSDEPNPALKSKKPKKIQTSMESWELGESSSLKVLRQWFYIPILEFITLKSFDGSSEQIARKLGLTTTAVDIAVSEMVSMGLIIIDNGRLKKSNAKLRLFSAKSKAEIRKFHDQMLTKAQESLRNRVSEKDFEKRLITGITISAAPEKIEQAKSRLAEFLHELANELTAEEGTEVYQLAAQLFPLTNSEE